jgi:peroxiredoxin
MRKILLVAALAGVLAAGGLVRSTLLAKVPPLPDPSKPRAKAFTLEDQNGEKVMMSKFTGQIVVLEWVNFDCPFVKRHYQEGTFKDLLEKYKYGIPGEAAPASSARGAKEKKKQRVVWLAVNSTHYANVESNKKATQEYKVPYPVLDDHEGKVGRLYGATNTPHIFIKAPDGTIAYQGAIDNDPQGEKEPDQRENYVAQALEELLKGQEVATPKTKPYGCSVKYAQQR